MKDDEQGDAFDLARFVSAQADTFDSALEELRRGRKQTHWMWFVFPQLDGLGRSPMAKRYAIRSLEEAGAYLKHPVLGPRLLACCRALLAISGKSAAEIMGDPDDLKLKSSMTLFALVEDGAAEFRAILEKYFDGERDARTLELLKSSGARGCEMRRRRAEGRKLEDRAWELSTPKWGWNLLFNHPLPQFLLHRLTR